MPDISKYIKDGRVEREKIAMDIKYGVLSKEELDILVSDKRISAAFKGDRFSDRKSKDEWTKDYLDELSYAVVAEGFNKEYLYYLYEVAAYVNHRKGGILNRLRNIVRRFVNIMTNNGVKCIVIAIAFIAAVTVLALWKLHNR